MNKLDVVYLKIEMNIPKQSYGTARVEEPSEQKHRGSRKYPLLGELDPIQHCRASGEIQSAKMRLKTEVDPGSQKIL